MGLSRPSLVHVLSIGLFGLTGLLLGGWPGFVIGVATAAALEVLGPAARRRLAVAAAALLAGAAIMTLLEGGTAITDLNLRFPRERPVANTLALAATILVVAVLFATIRSERAMSPSLHREHPTALRSPRWRPHGVWPWLTVGTLAVLIRVVFVPDGLPPGYASLADNLALGRGYLLGLGSDARPTGILTPLTPLIIAFAPGGPQTVLIAVSTSTVLMTGLLATRLFDRRIGVTAAVVAAMLPSLWGQQLPEALAALAVIVVLLLADPYRTSPWRLILAGSAIGVGMLARPEVILLVPLVICWWIAARDHPPWRHLLAASAILILVLQPWVGYLHRTFDRWTLSTSLGPTIAAAAAPAATEGPLIGAVDPDLERVPRDDEGSFAAEERERAGELTTENVSVAVVAMRILRGWDLVSPTNARAARQVRGLPFPGGEAGAIAEGAALLLAAIGWFTMRRGFRRALPIVMAPLLFTIESAAVFGDRGLRAWVAPLVAIAVAVGAVAVFHYVHEHVDS